MDPPLLCIPCDIYIFFPSSMTYRTNQCWSSDPELVAVVIRFSCPRLLSSSHSRLLIFIPSRHPIPLPCPLFPSPSPSSPPTFPTPFFSHSTSPLDSWPFPHPPP